MSIKKIYLLCHCEYINLLYIPMFWMSSQKKKNELIINGDAHCEVSLYWKEVDFLL